MGLIDADELKKCAIPCEIHNGALTDLCVPLYQIDNAPTVELQMGRMTNGIVIPIERPTGKWIPVTTRRMTDNEIIDAIGYGAWEELDESDKIDFWVYTCPLPKRGEKVLITTSYANGGDVVLTRFYANAEGSYFEDYELQTDVLAWQPLPEAYKKGTEE